MTQTRIFFSFFLVLLSSGLAQADEVRPFRITGMERSFGRIKDVGVSFDAINSSLLNNHQVGITICDDLGKERRKPSISYNRKLGEFHDAYRCVSRYSDGHSIVSNVTTSSIVTREGENYHLHGKLVITEQGDADPDELHIEDAIVPVEGPCKLIKYSRSNARPKMAKTFESKRIPEEIFTTSNSRCEWK